MQCGKVFKVSLPPQTNKYFSISLVQNKHSSSSGSDDVCLDCEAGKISEQGSTSCTICSSGKFSSAVSGSCTSCPSGKYIMDDATDISLHTSINSCIDCESGKMANDPTTASSCIICSAGKYSSAVSTSCTSCSPGKYITDDANTASLHADLVACVNCDAGKSSTPPASSCHIVCPTGTHSSPGSPCLDCEAGKFNENIQQETCTNCGTGRYSTTTGNTAISFCLNCEAGKASSEEDRTTPCPACPDGTSAPAPGLDSCPSCQAGTYSNNPDGAMTCTLCATGKYSSAAQSTSCDDCVAGTFNLVEGSVTCDKCPAGQKMNDAGDGCEVCPNGKFSNPGSTSCSSCDETPGYVSLSGESGAAACEYCGPGFYADQASHTCKECEIDSYSVGGVNECTSCPSGTDNAVASTSCSPCSPGTIPTGTSCDQCEKGKYGEFGATSCAPCDGDGQYADGLGLAACKTAPAGEKPTSDRQGVESCPAGKYSTGGNDECSECGSGETSDAGAAGCRTCATCGLGKFQIAECTADAETQCGDCIAGKASMGGAVSDCNFCDGPGEYSEPMASVCKTAPAGYKPTVTGDDGLKAGIEMCLKNTFSIGAADDCTNCAEGGHSNPGESSCDQCLTGKYYDEPTNSCQLYPKNTFSISGATDINGCEDCPAGGHSQPGSGYCDQCLTGKYYDEPTNSCQLCPKNTFSITGATDSNGCTPCATGEYSFEGSGYCQTCPQHMEYDETTANCVCLASFTRVDDITCTCTAGETLMGTTCEPCEKAKWKAEDGVTSCSLCSSTLEDSITEDFGSTSAKDCKCPKGTYDDGKGKCEVVKDGMDDTAFGMCLENVTIDPGFWRVNSDSTDVRECHVSEACTGGNSTSYCREGHTGPYCDLCVNGWTKDPLMLCKSCENSIVDVIPWWMLVAAVLGSLIYISKKKSRNPEEHRKKVKRFKNGGKIIFAGAQITASLPSVIPTIDLPNNVKETLKAASILNIDVFNMVSVGCWAASINYYEKALLMTLTIIAICGVLILAGRLVKKYRSRCFTSAIAIMYLVLPTVTTKIFGLFPCDELDDGSEMLRKDYTISCQDGDRDFWEAYGWLMVGVFPVGVISMYGFLLWSKRAKLKKPVEQRLEDEEITPLLFLWEPYKPVFWYWEVIETGRRLMMTGVLSTIEPGSFSQLVAGLMMNILYFGLLCLACPYNDNRDNSIAVLSTL
ncbi:hypothetical protein TrVE_jg3945 [Triparma verrucosa]|uniref:TNFR-Cys domain-containing protein n=1 Tax=Triparma verrucosa TaxID=1606542 RepID=A0A9W7BGU4_9STRA|nr:hypothetical protein TrVE_jg3945 [Triparma verrucosa]